MKSLNAFAIFILLLSIVVGLRENTITNGELVFRSVLVVLNLACCMCGEE